MSALYLIIATISGISLGAGLVYLYYQQRTIALRSSNNELSAEIKGLQAQVQYAEGSKEQMLAAFKAHAGDALADASEQLMLRAGEKLGAIGEQITQNIGQTKNAIGESMGQVSAVLGNLTVRAAALEEGLRAGTEVNQQLSGTTQALKQILSSSQARGQWGERMVSDILDKLGMVEGVNYESQKSIKSGERPDFIFNLPDGKTINMDVKFPLNKYEEYIQAQDDGVRAAAKGEFLKAVRGHAKTLAGRGYINPADETADYMLMFIPNESIYAFIHKHDPDIIDFTLEKGIILCSPVTLYAVLSLVRQSIRSFAMMAQTGEILTLLDEFRKQWGKYVEVQGKMGESLARAQRHYDDLVGTRTRGVDRIVEKVNTFEQPQLAAAPGDSPPLQMDG